MRTKKRRMMVELENRWQDEERRGGKVVKEEWREVGREMREGCTEEWMNNLDRKQGLPYTWSTIG